MTRRRPTFSSGSSPSACRKPLRRMVLAPQPRWRASLKSTRRSFGYREVIALDVGECETEAFWRSFLRGLVERGLSGVKLVVSDAHAGLKKANRGGREVGRMPEPDRPAGTTSGPADSERRLDRTAVTD